MPAARVIHGAAPALRHLAAVAVLLVAGCSAHDAGGGALPGPGDTVEIEGGSDSPTDPQVPQGAEPALTDLGRETTRLTGDARYRASIGDVGVRFRAEGDGWLAFVEDNALTITTGGDPPTGSIEMVRLAEAIDDGTVVDTSGLAVPRDPFASVSDVITPDGVPDLAAIEPLPPDWLAYIASLPGVDGQEPQSGTLGDQPAMTSRISVMGVEAHPDALCAVPDFGRCLTLSVGLGFFSYLNDGSTGEVAVVELDGERVVVTSTTRTADPDLSPQIARMLASVEWQP